MAVVRLVLAEKSTTAAGRWGEATYAEKFAGGARGNAAVSGLAVLAYSCSQPSLSPRSRVRVSPRPMAPARSAPRLVRIEVVVCCCTFRLKELAPHSLNAAWL